MPTKNTVVSETVVDGGNAGTNTSDLETLLQQREHEIESLRNEVEQSQKRFAKIFALYQDLFNRYLEA